MELNMGSKIEEVESLITELAQLPEKDIELANRFKEKVITVIRTLLPASENRVATASKIKFNDDGMVIEAKEDYMLRAWKKGVSQFQSLLEEVRHELQLMQKYHEPKVQVETTKEVPWWKNFDRRIAVIGLIVAVIGLWFAITKS